MLVTPDTSLAPERVSTRKQLNARELPGVPVALTSSFDAHVAALRARYQTTSSKRGRQKGAKQTWEHGRPATPSEGEAEDEEDEYWEGEKAALEAEERDEERAVAAVRRALR